MSGTDTVTITVAEKEQEQEQKEQKKGLKTREERIKEGIHLLKQLVEAGVKRGCGSFGDLKKQIDTWILTGDAWAGKIRFEEYGRVAEVLLPSEQIHIASLTFRVHE